jgi:hypothetical protein
VFCQVSFRIQLAGINLRLTEINPSRQTQFGAKFNSFQLSPIQQTYDSDFFAEFLQSPDEIAAPYRIGTYPSPDSETDHRKDYTCPGNALTMTDMEYCSATNDNHTHIARAFENTGIQGSAVRSSKRKGKRRHASRFDPNSGTKRTNYSNIAIDASASYQCTVCPSYFTNSWAWKRHELGTHDFHPIEWTCMLDNIIMLGQNCIFCSRDVDDDSHHFDQHHILPCFKRELPDRTFASKDRLKQHVKQVHLAEETDEAIKRAFNAPKSWSQVVAPANVKPDSLWCGFCLCNLPTTLIRMDHVAQHFKDGLSMDKWAPRLSV